MGEGLGAPSEERLCPVLWPVASSAAVPGYQEENDFLGKLAPPSRVWLSHTSPGKQRRSQGLAECRGGKEVLGLDAQKHSMQDQPLLLTHEYEAVTTQAAQYLRILRVTGTFYPELACEWVCNYPA